MPIFLSNSAVNLKEKTKIVVTIGVCVRNNAGTVGEAVESIAQQDFPHQSMEIVFVDSSEDETLTIIKERSSRIDLAVRIIYTSRKGLGHARNIVIDNSTSKYIVWVDGDMLLSRDYVRQLVEFMEEHPEIGIAKGRYSLKSGSDLLGTLEAYSRAVGKMVDFSSEKAQSKVLGTAGCIYRTQTAKQVKGFDEGMAGYGEDWDMEIRIRKAGWVFDTVNVFYSDHERCGLTWKSLWKRYWLRGYYSHFFLHKHRGFIELYKMLPPMGFLAGVFDSRKLFRLTGNATVFFLPVENMSKMIAWDIGFLESHMNSYQPG